MSYFEETQEATKQVVESNERPVMDTFFSATMTLNRAMFKPGQKIPVMTFIDRDLYSKTNSTFKNSVVYKPPIDEWKPNPEDMIFNHTRGAIIAPVHTFYGMSDDNEANNMIDFFYVFAKKCYNSNTKIIENEDGTTSVSIGFREHCCNYMNYFEKYYDTEYQLLGLYAKIKYMIDCETQSYRVENFIHDLEKYFINPDSSYTSQCLNRELDRMTVEQYNLELNYKNNKSPVLEYTDFHAQLLFKISVMQNMLIPLIIHFVTRNKMDSVSMKQLLLKIFDKLFVMTTQIYKVDLIAKIFETTFSNVVKNQNNNKTLWDMQSIRGKNTITHSIETIESLILQIIPKYSYDKNIIHFNYNAINRDTKYKITDIAYEYAFVVLSSSIRDDDNNSECDKYEAHSTKMDESSFIQTQVNCESTMKRIEIKYGPFDEREIQFYREQLTVNGKFVVNSLQKILVTYLFAKEFDDTQSTKIVNIRQYIILIIAARRLLESYNLVQLPYIIGGKVARIVTRKNINKKELQKIESSKYYPLIHEKYNNEKIEKEVILSLIAQILSSEFQVIDYYNQEYNNISINIIPDVVSEEVCRFILLI